MLTQSSYTTSYWNRLTMTIRLTITLLAAVLLSTNLRSQEETFSPGELNDAIAFLAGMEFPHQADHPLTGSSSWTNHVAQLDKDFKSHQERVLFPMSAWSNASLTSSLVTGSTVRYLFSGPDILHAFHMFPTAGQFVMCGLEPVGEIPDLGELNTGNASKALGEVRNALGEIINLSFFRTKDMKDDLQFATFRGTTPIIMIFLARSGQYIKGVEFLELNTDGTLTSKGMDSKGADGVKIDFGPQRLQQTKSVYYFSSDLSDSGFDSSGFETWLKTLPRGNAYLKAASFLMHQSWFTKVRTHLLDYSDQVVQDDSGIPFKYFKADEWYADLYGVYTGPIDLFAEYYQRDMRSAYQTRRNPLDFGTGYKWRKGESNLMRFLRQDALPEETSEATTAEEPQSATTDPDPEA
ncbi:MAG: hypothetical protein P1U68_09465 [Verrucomicrobiales bacterium]|nr:hypothetical protein [Verrucomicrobiales bacterium]